MSEPAPKFPLWAMARLGSYRVRELSLVSPAAVSALDSMARLRDEMVLTVERALDHQAFANSDGDEFFRSVVLDRIYAVRTIEDLLAWAGVVE